MFCLVISGMAKSQDLEDNELLSVARRLTTVEMKELNERQRAEHASRMYEQQKTLFRQLEDRNFELEHKFAEVGTVPVLCFPVVFMFSCRSLSKANESADVMSTLKTASVCGQGLVNV